MLALVSRECAHGLVCPGGANACTRQFVIVLPASEHTHTHLLHSQLHCLFVLSFILRLPLTVTASPPRFLAIGRPTSSSLTVSLVLGCCCCCWFSASTPGMSSNLAINYRTDARPRAAVGGNVGQPSLSNFQILRPLSCRSIDGSFIN